MLVKESRIADVALEQSGTLHLSALPETPFEFTLSKITPLTEARDGATYFIVEGSYSPVLISYSRAWKASLKSVLMSVS